MLKTHFFVLLRYIAIVGNILFFFIWVFFNNGNEGFNGNFLQKASSIVLTLLLVINSLIFFKINKFSYYYFVKYAIIASNIVFILWVLLNGINEGFRGTLTEKFIYIGLMGLLAFDSILHLSLANEVMQNSD